MDADGVAGRPYGPPQDRHARDVAIIFASLIGSASVDLPDRFGVDAAASHYCFEQLGEQIIGPNRSELSAKSTNG